MKPPSRLCRDREKGGRSPPALPASSGRSAGLGAPLHAHQGPAGTGKTKTACALLAATYLHRARLDAKRSDVATTSRGGAVRGGVALLELAAGISRACSPSPLRMSPPTSWWRGWARWGARASRRPAGKHPARVDASLDAEIERSPAVDGTREAQGRAGQRQPRWSRWHQEVRRAERAAALQRSERRTRGRHALEPGSCRSWRRGRMERPIRAGHRRCRCHERKGKRWKRRRRGGRGLVGRGRAGRPRWRTGRGIRWRNARRWRCPSWWCLRSSVCASPVLVDEATQAGAASLVPLLFGCAQHALWVTPSSCLPWPTSGEP